MSAVITDEKIPNNVNLSGDKRLQRALEAWQPKFIDWWKDMGPVGWQDSASDGRPTLDGEDWPVCSAGHQPDLSVFSGSDSVPGGRLVGRHQPVVHRVQPPEPVQPGHQ